MQTTRLSTLACAVFAFALFIPQNIQAQLEFSLKWLDDEEQWGVYVKPLGSISPTPNTVTASGQISLVAPLDFEIGNHEDFNGKWDPNSQVTSPDENPDRQYIFFGFVSNNPHLLLEPGEETLLIKFPQSGGDCPDSLYLVDNDNDPLMVFPNSAGINPGNDLSILDIDAGAAQYYYSGNYDEHAWNCHPEMTNTDNLIFDKSAIQAYPNPYTEFFKIKIPEALHTEDLKVEIFNLTGKKVSEKAVRFGDNNRFGGDLKKGFYIFELKNLKGKVFFAGKVLKE